MTNLVILIFLLAACIETDSLNQGFLDSGGLLC